MNEEKIEKVKCSKCDGEFMKEEVEETKKGLVCKNCIAKAKKRKRNYLIAGSGTGIVAAAIATAVSLNGGKSVEGFDGVSQIKDSTTLTVNDAPNSFKMDLAIAKSAPVEAGKTVNNIEDFQNLMSGNISKAKKENTSSIEIPSIGVLFDFNSAAITPSGKKLLEEYAKTYLQTNKEAQIIIYGYTCDLGTDEVNNLVSKQRAENVRSVLTEKGVAAEKMTTRWYGKKKYNEFDYPTKEEYRRVIISIE